ncbi:MAG: Rrf2 family transcriptional regulator [Planktotalea sp.]|uniref:Rrf2 family transcriptional regulator n=1 Tax=Planktotalea sp. TaxID=2029877 RepID=UPI002612ADD5|nr:Rrf2 family transcriptional regulator [Planktotalea sp.]MDG1084445.1 Rrf2 family transcriptional regulator [Planktotalea sp.]
MKLSTKGRYALVSLVDIAKPQNQGLVSIAEVSRRQDISLAYLEQLFSKIRRNDLVVSTRGHGGGYKLARDASAISIEEILLAVDENIDALSTGAGMKGGDCGSIEQVLSNKMWESLSAQVHLYLHRTTLADVIDDSLSPCPAMPSLSEFEET